MHTAGASATQRRALYGLCSLAWQRWNLLLAGTGASLGWATQADPAIAKATASRLETRKPTLECSGIS